MLGLIPKPYFALLALILICALTGGAFVKGIGIGAKTEAAKWQADKIKEQQAAAEKAEAMRQTIAKLEAERQQKLEAGANEIERIRVEYLPAKIEVRREVVDRAVFRDCRIGDGMRDTLNAALAGRPVPGADALGAGDAGLPGGA